jgi:short-subunit dehydrogenase
MWLANQLVLPCGCVQLLLQDTIMQEQHKIDILVNNAGILAKAAVTEAGTDHFRKVLEVNFFACIELIAAVAPIMMQQHSGTIVNVGSIASYTAQVHMQKIQQSMAVATGARNNHLRQS